MFGMQKKSNNAISINTDNYKNIPGCIAQC